MSPINVDSIDVFTKTFGSVIRVDNNGEKTKFDSEAFELNVKSAIPNFPIYEVSIKNLRDNTWLLPSSQMWLFLKGANHELVFTTYENKVSDSYIEVHFHYVNNKVYGAELYYLLNGQTEQFIFYEVPWFQFELTANSSLDEIAFAYVDTIERYGFDTQDKAITTMYSFVKHLPEKFEEVKDYRSVGLVFYYNLFLSHTNRDMMTEYFERVASYAYYFLSKAIEENGNSAFLSDCLKRVKKNYQKQIFPCRDIDDIISL